MLKKLLTAALCALVLVSAAPMVMPQAQAATLSAEQMKMLPQELQLRIMLCDLDAALYTGGMKRVASLRQDTACMANAECEQAVSNVEELVLKAGRDAEACYKQLEKDAPAIMLKYAK